MEEDSLHVLVVVRMTMAVVMVPMTAIFFSSVYVMNEAALTGRENAHGHGGRAQKP